MPETKRIVVLANSRKPPGRCVAGIELVDGDAADWVRPVGDRAGAGLTRPERLLADRSEPLPLDVVDFVVGRPVPVDCHRENWLLRSGSPRGRVGTFDFDDLDARHRTRRPSGATTLRANLASMTGSQNLNLRSTRTQSCFSDGAMLSSRPEGIPGVASRNSGPSSTTAG